MYRQLMDDREKSLALLMGERIRGLRRAVTEIAERVDRQHPSLLVARLRNRLASGGQRLETAASARLRTGTETVTVLATRLAERHPRHRVRLVSQRLSDLESRFRRAIADDLQRRSGRLEALSAHLLAVGPEQVLRRGFTLTIRKRDGRILRSVAEIRPGDRMITRFADGQVEWTAEDPRQPGLFP
jgi:exodeoxyribonuclease VII large subunit